MVTILRVGKRGSAVRGPEQQCKRTMKRAKATATRRFLWATKQAICCVVLGPRPAV